MSGGFGEMGNLLEQAQKMQRALDEAREALKSETVDGTAGGGVVRVVVTGEGQVTEVKLADAVFQSHDKAMLEDLLKAALSDGITKAARMREERLSKISGGLNLPGLF